MKKDKDSSPPKQNTPAKQTKQFQYTNIKKAISVFESVFKNLSA